MSNDIKYTYWGDTTSDCIKCKKENVRVAMVFHLTYFCLDCYKDMRTDWSKIEQDDIKGVF